MTRYDFIMDRVKEHYDEAVSLGFEVVGVFLQGSQNYNLDCYDAEYQSDIDTKAIILPSFEDVVNGDAPYSHTHVRANNEHIDIKDIRQMFEMFEKQNNAYVEILFTDFKVVNPKYADLVDELLSWNDAIARYDSNQALRCFSGTSMEKYKALEHPYPTTMAKIDKFGYDPKQLHHILRLNDMMVKYAAGKPYKECLVPDDAEYLIKVKKGLYGLDEARVKAKEGDDLNKKIKDDNLKTPEPVHPEVKTFLDDLKVKFIRRFLIEELSGGKK